MIPSNSLWTVFPKATRESIKSLPPGTCWPVYGATAFLPCNCTEPYHLTGVTRD